MAKFKDLRLEMNERMTELPAFLDSYNKTLPEGFPPASTRLLRKFQSAHPLLFKSSDAWSIVKHRKKLMDWLSSYRESE